VFDEKIRVGVLSADPNQQYDDIQSIRWWVENDIFLKFTTGVDWEDYGVDDGRSVMVQALHQVTPSNYNARIYAEITFHDGQTFALNPGEIEIISDQVQYLANVIEAPYVGVSMSTAQLYLTTNIGYQVFKNSFLSPNRLSSIQVSAVLQNSFAVSMYMSGGGEFPIQMKDSDASNLTFTLVDANYKPVKLMSPMYVILRIESTENTVEDIKAFKNKLPKDQGSTIKPIFYEQPKINLNQSDETFSVNREMKPTPETVQLIQQQAVAQVQQQVQAQQQSQAQAPKPQPEPEPQPQPEKSKESNWLLDGASSFMKGLLGK
jgi:hypothetical protein